MRVVCFDLARIKVFFVTRVHALIMLKAYSFVMQLLQLCGLFNGLHNQQTNSAFKLHPSITR